MPVAISKVQRTSKSYAAAGTSLTFDIDVDFPGGTNVDASKTIVLGTWEMNAQQVGTLARVAQRWSLNSNGETIDCEGRLDAVDAGVITGHMQLVEFESGITVHHATAVIASTDPTTFLYTVPGMNLDAGLTAFCILNGFETDRGGGQTNQEAFTLEVANQTQVRIQSNVGAWTATNLEISFQVVQFDNPSDANVYRGVANYKNGTPFVDVAVGATVDRTKSLINCQGFRHDQPPYSSQISFTPDWVNDTTFRITQFEASGSFDTQLAWEVVEILDNFSIQDTAYTGTIADAGTDVGVAITAVTDTALTMVWPPATYPLAGSGGSAPFTGFEDYRNAIAALDLTTASNVQLRRLHTNGAADHSFFVGEWSAAAPGPTVDSITPNTPTSATHPAGGSVQVSGGDGGLAYWCHAPTSAGALTEAQIRDGDGGTYPFGTIPLTGDPATETLPLVTGLSPSTSYTWHIFGEEAGPGASGEIATQAYSTAGAPFVSSIVPGTVSETALLTSQATLSLDLTGGNGTYWAAVYPSGATPSHADIKAGAGAIGAVQTGALDSDPDTVVFSAFGGLASNTNYLLFVTAEDAVATPSVPDSAAFATENAQPNITNWQVTAVNTTTADFTITATDDEPNVEYCIAAYPQSSVVSDADLVADCRAAPAGGGVPSPNPRGALWAVSQTQTQGTAYADQIELLVGNTTYEVEHAAVDASNTTRGANTNITTGFRTCTQAQPWKNADGTDIGARSNWTWGWIDRDGSPQAGDVVTDAGTVNTDAAGNWSSAVQLVNATTANGQFGTLLMFFNDTTSGRLRMQFYRYQVSVTPGAVN